jgi:hypothetical protein
MRTRFGLVFLALVLASGTLMAQVPPGWEKVTGVTSGYSGVADGILNDRQNSYAWSMGILGEDLYVGTSRNIFGSMLAQAGMLVSIPQIPVPADMRGRIYKMNLRDRQWTQVYVSQPMIVPGKPVMGEDLGYRMMRTYRAPIWTPMLYVGSAGLNEASLLAISPSGKVQRIFRTSGAKPNKMISIRAISEHRGMLFWAGEDSNGPVIWYSMNPILAYWINPQTAFHRLDVPKDWFTPAGAEIVDMISYHGALYVFFLPYDNVNSGFWCAKAELTPHGWEWEVVVGDSKYGAKYPAGMGRMKNGAAVPIEFKGKIYVGTLDGAAFRMMTGNITGNPGTIMGGPAGAQIYRFDQRDEWERLMPSPTITDSIALESANGFNNPLNKYIWRFGMAGGRLYAGTFDLGTGLQLMQSLMPGLPPDGVSGNPFGFDLYSTRDGETWRQESLNGFNDPWNYGTRTFVTDPRTGNLFMGTANPFYGCQVWRKAADLEDSE